ncbi:putative reverse transcriptase domain-containing protein [Tanacetum coccineum]
MSQIQASLRAQARRTSGYKGVKQERFEFFNYHHLSSVPSRLDHRSKSLISGSKGRLLAMALSQIGIRALSYRELGCISDMSNSDELRHTDNTTLVPPRLPDTLPQGLNVFEESAEGCGVAMELEAESGQVRSTTEEEEALHKNDSRRIYPKCTRGRRPTTTRNPPVKPFATNRNNVDNNMALTLIKTPILNPLNATESLLEALAAAAGIAKDAEGDRVKFASSTLLDGALAWWNVYVHSVTLDTAHATPWSDFKAMFIQKYYPRNEIKQMENELWNLKGNVTSSKPVDLHEAIEMAQGLMYQVVQELGENSGGGNQIQGNSQNHQNNQRQNQGNPKGSNQASTSTQGGRRAPGRVYNLCAEAAVKDNNVVNGTFLINNVYASVLFDTGVDRSFMYIMAYKIYRSSPPTTLDTNYSVELADGKSLTTNTILRGCTLNLQNHLFKIDLLPIELGSFDVIVGMDWMAEHRAEVVCYEKYIRVPYKNDMLIIQGERSGIKSESRLEVISSIRTQKIDDLFDQLQGSNIYSKIDLRSEHEEHLKTILELLKKEELYAKFSKCEFWINTVKFLGHVIDSSGIHMDPAKIEAVKNWASPTTPSEICQFLGLTGYYRRFIEGFSKIAKPMTELTQKN